jgi:hypothetical protein
MNENKYCISLFLDFKKAFDTVPHDILLKKLEKLGITGTALNWFASYLSNRTQKVEVNSTLSDSKELNISVFQGTCLGPILFLCFVMIYLVPQTYSLYSLLTTLLAWTPTVTFLHSSRVSKTNSLNSRTGALLTKRLLMLAKPNISFFMCNVSG